MYSTCLFCHSSLGTNALFETFPVGRRLAYDPARGRLWVVCPRCARWNLSPLEERWEAIEQAERLQSASTLRVGGESISLVRVAENVELVRIGAPSRSELAVWRYGDAFRRRRTRNLLLGGTVGVVGAAASLGLAAAGIGLLLAAQLASFINEYSRFGRPTRMVTRIRMTDGRLIPVNAAQLRWSYLGRGMDGGLTLQLGPTRGGVRAPLTVTGAEATAALRKMLPAVNRMGGTRGEIERALARIVEAGTTAHLLERVARDGAGLTGRDEDRGFVRQMVDEALMRRTGLTAMPPDVALALEMALNEDVERLALEGEVAELEAAWLEAEEIARIADDMFLPESVESELARLRARVDRAARTG